MKTIQQKTVIRYSISFKQMVVKEVEEGEGLEFIRKKYDIAGSSTIQKWLKNFGKNHLLNKVVRVENMNEKDKLKQLEQDNKRLKLALADAYMAKVCLEGVIKMANEEYKTDLKKFWRPLTEQFEREYKITSLCAFWEVSRQAFYKDRKAIEVRQKQKDYILASVKNIRKEHVRLGTLKLRFELREELKVCGRGFGRDKFFDLLRNHGLLVKRRRRYSVTTNSNHAFYKHKNQLAGLTITAPDQAWVSDITYLKTRNKFVYLSLVTDVYSRKIIGWNVDSSLAVEGALEAVKMAIRGCSDTRTLIHHSDRGVQYCCHAYNDLLKSKGIVMSMGEAGNCYDNAIAERVNGIVKDEYLLDSEFLNKEQAIKAVRQAIYLYNHKRPHWSLNLQKPARVYRTKPATEKKVG